MRLISEEEGSTDMDEAEALNWQNYVVDIYSNSWGPNDDGMTVSGPGPLAEMALETSIREVQCFCSSKIIMMFFFQGRGGLGSIFTFPAGIH